MSETLDQYAIRILKNKIEIEQVKIQCGNERILAFREAIDTIERCQSDLDNRPVPPAKSRT